MKFYQWLALLIACFFIYKVIKQYTMRKRLFGSTIIWVAFWIVTCILALIPDVASISLAEFLGIDSNINAVFFLALGFLYFFMFYTTAVIEKIEKQMTDIVRKLALDNQKLKEELKEAKELRNEDSLHP